MAVRCLARPLLATAVLASASLLSACNVELSMKGEARDKWQRHYTLARGGSVEIRNTNGVIQVTPGSGDEVDITAERIVQAPTDQAAKDGLAGFEIHETAGPDRIVIDGTGRGGGLNFTFNLSRRVDYSVRLPEWANLTLSTTNGNITVDGKLMGSFRAEATNGRINASGLENGVSATTTNGAITIDVTRLGEDGVSCETTNGTIDLTVPHTVNARLSVRVTNGAIRPEGLNLAVSEQSRRRLDATLGTGGPTIKLETTNGAVRIRGK